MKRKHLRRFRVVGGGEIDLPDEFAQRWETHSVSIEDHGEYIVVRPALEVSEQMDDDWAADVDVPAAPRRGSTGMGY